MIVLNVTTEGRTRLLGLSKARSWVLASSHSPCSFRGLLHRTSQDRAGRMLSQQTAECRASSCPGLHMVLHDSCS